MSESLNVIALISGGKDSFYSLLHCLRNGHRVVALANLYPARIHDGKDFEVESIPADQGIPGAGSLESNTDDDDDLNSFMYQTVGHEIIPLYASVTGLPLYRQPIIGGAAHQERDYDVHCAAIAGSANVNDETESMIPLLRHIIAQHPEANAISAGAILSNYQRTRVESVALRLGLTPLAYLWKYPTLPSIVRSSAPADEVQLLFDMCTAGLDARIIKVASAGLDERHLWECVSSLAGARRIKQALRKFGISGGSALGEGGEFETMVVDGPSCLFKKRIIVGEAEKREIQEEGGTARLSFRGASLDTKPGTDNNLSNIRVPDLLDHAFRTILESAFAKEPKVYSRSKPVSLSENLVDFALQDIKPLASDLVHRTILLEAGIQSSTVEEEAAALIAKTQAMLLKENIDSSHIMSIVLIFRNMADFAKINGLYSQLFPSASPPSRVTISCGDLLTPGRNIMMHLTATTERDVSKIDKNGLHVQSRSYWAPANIGPYSQAIQTNVLSQTGPTGLKAVSIAGQIPLIPASMALPASSYTSLGLQATLSLQHLWRIGSEMKVQTWTSAVAYFPKALTASETQLRTAHAVAAWTAIHMHSKPVENDDNGSDDADGKPDLWDLKYNPEHLILTSDAAESSRPLPDWSVFCLLNCQNDQEFIPPCFGVEVDELPRQSSIEWHAHYGLSGIQPGDVTVHHYQIQETGWIAWHMSVQLLSKTHVYTHSAIYLEMEDDMVVRDQTILLKDAQETMSILMQRPHGLSLHGATQYMTYMDCLRLETAWLGDENAINNHIVPCRSLWSPSGHRLSCVTLWKSVFTVA